MKKIGWLILAVVAVAIVVWFVGRSYGPRPAALRSHVIPLVFAPVGGNCQLTQKPGRQKVRRGDAVVWRVENRGCGGDTAVELTGFTPTDPLRDTDEAAKPGRRATAGNNKNETIDTEVLGSAQYGVYTYHIRLNGTEIDPDIEVAG